MYENLFSKRGLSLDRLRALVEIEQAGSIAKAVGGDSVRQSQYSRQLKELESYFEVELTKRQGKGLVLTDAGKHLAHLAREQFIGLSDFQESWNEQPQAFNVGAGDSLLHWLFIPAMPSILKDTPDVSFTLNNLRSTSIVEELLDLKLDFGIIHKKAHRKPLKHKDLGRITYTLFVPKMMLKGRSKVTPEWILDNLPLATQAHDSTFHKTLELAARDMDISLKIQLYCESFPEAAEALRNKSHIAILPTIAGRMFSSNEYRSFKLSLLDRVSRTASLVWNPRMLRLRPKSERLLKLLGSTLTDNI